MASASLNSACFTKQHRCLEKQLVTNSSPHWKPSGICYRSTKITAILATSNAATISETFARLKEEKRLILLIPSYNLIINAIFVYWAAFIPYITAGDPDLNVTSEALKVLDSCGSDIIELGLPYSDPLADGPIIQAAATRALAQGNNFQSVIGMLRNVVPELSCPIALLSYYNPILKYGIGNFMSSIKDVGVNGLVVPDVPLEETQTLSAEAIKNNIELVLLTTPTTPASRMTAIVEASEGFVYLVSSVGVTGTRASVSAKVETLLKQIKQATTKHVAVGFGISKPEHVAQVVEWGADGVIVGSAVMKVLGDAKSPEEGLKDLETFTKSLTSALHS